MPSILKKVLGGLCSCVSTPGDEKADIPLVQNGRRVPTPTPAAKALELELAGERARCARLEEDRRRAKAEADAFADAKGKLEDEIREVKELLKAREKEVGHKDASVEQLERSFSEMQAKVSRVGRTMGSNS
jgi:chromosome segregation ATPase